MKNFFAIILISIIFIFNATGIVLAKQFKCECTSAAQDKILDVQDINVCNSQCQEYCLSNGGLKKCTEIINAQNSGNQQNASLDNPIGADSVSGVIGKIIKIFLGIIGTISLIMFIYGGFMILTSAGRAGQIKTGQQTLVWASIGILVVFASYALLKFVFSAFGI